MVTVAVTTLTLTLNPSSFGARRRHVPREHGPVLRGLPGGCLQRPERLDGLHCSARGDLRQHHQLNATDSVSRWCARCSPVDDFLRNAHRVAFRAQ